MFASRHALTTPPMKIKRFMRSNSRPYFPPFFPLLSSFASFATENLSDITSLWGEKREREGVLVNDRKERKLARKCKNVWNNREMLLRLFYFASRHNEENNIRGINRNSAEGRTRAIVRRIFDRRATTTARYTELGFDTCAISSQ